MGDKSPRRKEKKKKKAEKNIKSKVRKPNINQVSASIESKKKP